MKIFSERKLKKTDYIVIALIGVLLLVIAVPTGSKMSISKGNSLAENSSSDEKKLKRVLEAMEGVGRVNVMITTTNDNKGMFNDVDTKVEGVVIVAEGAGKATIDKNILEVVMALFDVEVHKIKIVKMSL